MPYDDPLLDTKESAKYIGLKNHKTMYTWQCTKRYNLPYVKIGSKVLYRKSDLDAFIMRNLRNNWEGA